jgi:hypothetical protein
VGALALCLARYAIKTLLFGRWFPLGDNLVTNCKLRMTNEEAHAKDAKGAKDAKKKESSVRSLLPWRPWRELFDLGK